MNKDNITDLLHHIQETEGENFVFNESEILKEYEELNTEKSSIFIKIVTILGGFLATLAFLGFLFITGIYNSSLSLTIFGLIFISASIFISKTLNTLLVDTLCVSSFALGFSLLGFGLNQFGISENLISFIFIILAIISLFLVQNFILSFISILIINGSILWLIISYHIYNLIHIHISILAIVLSYIFLKEAKILTSRKIISKLYNPIRIGLVFSFLLELIYLSKRGLIPLNPNYIWLSSIATIACIMYLIFQLFPILKIKSKNAKITTYIIGFLMLIPTSMSPAISGAILIILLSYYVNLKGAFYMGILACIYFISQYYYDLDFTLLVKSIILFSSGILFIFLYLFTHKKLQQNEKI